MFSSFIIPIHAQSAPFAVQWSYTTGGMASVSVSNDGSYIAAGGDKVYLFQKSSGNPLWTYSMAGIQQVSISGDGQYVAVGTGDNKVILFSKDSNVPLWIYSTGQSGVLRIAISNDGNYVVAGTLGGKVYLFSRSSSTPLWSYSIGGYVYRVSISNDGSYVAVAGDDTRAVFLFQRSSGAPLWTYTTGGCLWSSSISGDGKYIVAGSGDNNVYLFDKASGLPLWQNNVGSMVYSSSISGDGNYIVAGGRYNGIVYLFGKASNTPLWSYNTGSGIVSTSISNNGNLVATGGEYGKVTFFNKDTSTPLWSYQTGNYVYSVSASSDGNFLAACSQDNKIYLFGRAVSPSEETPPTVVGYSPTGTSVPVTTTISVTFSEAMNQASVQNAFSTSPPIIGSFSWSGNTMTFTPSSNLAYATTYSVTVGTGAKDTAGNNLQSPCNWQFKTVSGGVPPDTIPPSVLITSPTSGQTFTTSTITVSGTASDNVAVSMVQVRVGGGSWATASGTTSWSAQVTLSSGQNTIYVGATDTSGNPSSEASVTVTYNPIDYGTLLVDTTPVKGDIYVDGTLWGKAPQSRTVSAGTHTASAGPVTGYKTPSPKTVTVTAGQTTTVTLEYIKEEAQTGTLSIDTIPVKGEVFVNGQSWGAAPQRREVPTGSYTVSFGSVTGYNMPSSQTVTVYKGLITTVTGMYILKEAYKTLAKFWDYKAEVVSQLIIFFERPDVSAQQQLEDMYQNGLDLGQEGIKAGLTGDVIDQFTYLLKVFKNIYGTFASSRAIWEIAIRNLQNDQNLKDVITDLKNVQNTCLNIAQAYRNHDTETVNRHKNQLITEVEKTKKCLNSFLDSIKGKSYDVSQVDEFTQFINRGETVTFSVNLKQGSLSKIIITINQDPRPNLFLGIFGKPSYKVNWQQSSGVYTLSGQGFKITNTEYGAYGEVSGLNLPYTSSVTNPVDIIITADSLGAKSWSLFFSTPLESATLTVKVESVYQTVTVDQQLLQAFFGPFISGIEDVLNSL